MKQWLISISLSLLAVLAPIKALLIAVGFLIFADTVSGILAARKRGEKISSAKLRGVITKAFVYQICVISGFVMEKYIVDGILPVSKIIAGAIAAVEIKSILENSNTILGMDLFAEVKARLGSPNLPKE
jgi:hypothetical protein